MVQTQKQTFISKLYVGYNNIFLMIHQGRSASTVFITGLASVPGVIHKYVFNFIVRIERSNNINVSIRDIVSYDTPFTSNT